MRDRRLGRRGFLAASVSSVAGLTCSLASSTQTTSTFEGLPAIVLDNGALRLTVFYRGATFAKVILAGDPAKGSPFWNPAAMARAQGREWRDNGSFGHFVCVDGFGPVSAEEKASGLPHHGEAHFQNFEIQVYQQRSTTELVASAKLPLVRENFTRTVRMADNENVVYVRSLLKSELAFDRPVCWGEHATMSSPWLEPETVAVDIAASRSITRKYQGNPSLPYRLPDAEIEFKWPMAPSRDGKTLIDLRAAPAHPNSTDQTATLLDRTRPLAYWTAVHRTKQVIFGYLFKPEEYPWVQDWESYRPNGLTRGLEFAGQPFDVPRREAVERHSLFDAPVYRWLPAMSAIESSFLFFYANTPEGFQRVDDVRFDGGFITVVDRHAGKQIMLPASLSL